MTTGVRGGTPRDSLVHGGDMIERLIRWPLFRDVRPQALADLVRHLIPRDHPAGQIVFVAGEPTSYLYWVDCGFAALRQISPEGREHILEYVGPGRSLNLAASLDGGPQVATAEGLTDLTLLAVERTVLLELLHEHPDLTLALARRLAQEARQLSETVRGLALDTVRMRLAAFLLEHAEHTPTQERWTQERIAAHIGTVRDVVGRILRDFVQEGLVRREQGQLVIVDRQGLERETGGTIG
jgi:CRP-like cAMP-binding protein